MKIGGYMELEGGVKLNDLNMNQDVQGIVADYNRKVKENDSHGSDDIKDLSEQNHKLVQSGRLDAKTGILRDRTVKAQTVTIKQCCPSREYLMNYDGIRWD